MEKNYYSLTNNSYLLDHNVIIKTFLILFFIIEGFVLYFMLFEKITLFIVLFLLISVIFIILRPNYGLYLSTMLAYSNIASNLLQGMFMPVILLTAFAWIIYFLNSKSNSVVDAHQNILFILLGVLMLLSSFYASDIENSVKSLYAFVKYLILYFLIINILNSWQSVRYFIWILTITGVSMFIYGLYISFFSSTGMSVLRLTSFIEDPNSFAIKLIPLVAFSYILIKTEKIFILRIVSFLFLISIVTAILLTFSRGGFLALFTVLFLIFLNEFKNKRNILIIGSVIFLVMLILPMDIFFYRFKSIEDLTKDVSIVQRLRILKGGLAMFADHPFLGVGIGNFVTHSQDYCNTIRPRVAHNSYLEIATETGILGLVLFMSLLLVTLNNLRRCWKHLMKITESKQYYYPLGMLFALLGFMVHALFLSEQFNIALYIMIALTVIICKMTPIFKS